MISLEFWYMFPAAILIATTAMASGVEGATFFAPLFLLALGLSPEIAIGTGLITEVFGFTTGLVSYTRKRLIDFRLGSSLLIVTIPMAVVGTVLSSVIAADILKTILGVGLFVVALSFLRSPDAEDVEHLEEAIEETYGGEKAETCLVTADGEEVRYTVCNRSEGRLIAGIGSLFMGLVSTGLGEMNGYFLLQRCRVPSKVAVATSVFVVAVTALVASAGHFIGLARAGGEVLATVLNLCLFTVPGVIVGGVLGTRVASRIPQTALERSMGLLFVLVAALTLGQVVLG